MDPMASDMEKMAVEEGADRKLLIAVDFGTTFSGVAWAQTRRVRTLQMNINQPLGHHSLTLLVARCSDYHHSVAR